MIYVVVNGLLIEGETLVEIHMRAEIRRYEYKKVHVEEVSDDDTITSIVREVLKQLEK